MQVRSFVAMVAVVLGLSLPTAAMAASITWNTPVAITDVNTTLGLPGTVLEAASWGTTGSVVVTDTFGTITFQQGGDFSLATTGPVTTTSGGGGYNAPGSGVFSGPSTGNANFDAVLDSNAFTGSPNLARISGLTSGTTYTVQIFAMDGRNVTTSARTLYFSDTSDGSGSNSAVISNGSNQYVLGTFIAGGATEDFWALGASGNTEFNAVVIRAIPEPTGLTLLGLGGIGMSLLARKRRRSR